MERLTRNDRANPVAAAHDINDQMKIILNSTWASMELLEPGHPAPAAAVRSERSGPAVWKTAAMLRFSARRGIGPVNVPLEQIAQD